MQLVSDENFIDTYGQDAFKELTDPDNCQVDIDGGYALSTVEGIALYFE